MGKPGFPKEAAPGGVPVRRAVALAPEHEQRPRQAGEDLLPQGQGPGVAAVMEPLKRIQDAIGVWHDWLTLTATAESVPTSSGQAPLLSALRASTRSKYLEALRITADAKRALLELSESKRMPGKPVSRSAAVAASPPARAATA